MKARDRFWLVPHGSANPRTGDRHALVVQPEETVERFAVRYVLAATLRKMVETGQECRDVANDVEVGECSVLDWIDERLAAAFRELDVDAGERLKVGVCMRALERKRRRARDSKRRAKR